MTFASLFLRSPGSPAAGIVRVVSYSTINLLSWILAMGRASSILEKIGYEDEELA